MAGKKRDAERTRERILNVATRLFAKSGFEGCSVSSLVKAAKVNQRMVYHYFGDKKGLYREVFRRQWLRLAENVEHRLSGPMLEEVLAAFFEYLAENQDFVRLMMWEALEGGQISVSLWPDVRGPFFHRIRGLIEEAKHDGRVAKDLDSAHLIITFLGASTFYFAYAPTLKEMVGKEPLSAAAILERGEELQRLLRHLHG